MSTTLALGRAFSCFLNARGQVRCWGTNDSGQCGGRGGFGDVARSSNIEWLACEAWL
ncbi:hypothetical protein [Polyangium mundeleinium]|uniref:hypothetical protein n=1 Tax=Polyangium mundeleinium TaxID=2995306 RepID=UPI00358DD83D